MAKPGTILLLIAVALGGFALGLPAFAEKKTAKSSSLASLASQPASKPQASLPAQAEPSPKALELYKMLNQVRQTDPKQFADLLPKLSEVEARAPGFTAGFIKYLGSFEAQAQSAPPRQVQTSNQFATSNQQDYGAYSGQQPIRTYTSQGAYSSPSSYKPPVAENGDRRGYDNDGDGRVEPVHVRGYYRSDGTYVRGHYRASPSR